jgi:hypothetical protein
MALFLYGESSVNLLSIDAIRGNGESRIKMEGGLRIGAKKNNEKNDTPNIKE